jgi:succinate-semialdehyde dehydrogenase/glutarate-semialdehyde dehydrogenase
MTQTTPIPAAGESGSPAGALGPVPATQWSPRVSAAMLARLAAQAAVAAPAEPMPVEAPFTGETLAEVPTGTPADVEAACAAARASQVGWTRLPAQERAAVLLRYHDLVIASAPEILDLIQLETGKARIHAY